MTNVNFPRLPEIFHVNIIGGKQTVTSPPSFNYKGNRPANTPPPNGFLIHKASLSAFFFLLFYRRGHQAGKQRMGPVGPGFEFRMELQATNQG